LAKIVILVFTAGLAIAAWAVAVSLHRPVTWTVVLQVSALFGGVLAVAALLILRHQRRYFGAGARYWLVIERDKLTLVTPDRREVYGWQDLTRFVVEKEVRETMDAEKHPEQCVAIRVTSVDSGPDGRKLRIAAGDFATRLPGNRLEQAQRLCAILNNIRRWATESNSEPGVLPRRTVSGLVLAPGREVAKLT